LAVEVKPLLDLFNVLLGAHQVFKVARLLRHAYLTLHRFLGEKRMRGLVLGLQLEHLVVYDELLKCLLLLRPGEEKVVFLHALVESRDILRVDGQQLSGRLVMSVVQDH